MRYYKYGSRTSNIYELAERLGETLGISFKLHESDHFNGEYFKETTAQKEVIYLTNNESVDEDGDVLEPDFLEYRSILELHRTPPGSEISRQLALVPELEFISVRSQS